MDIYNVIKKPLMNEATALDDSKGKYYFIVDKRATKLDVRAAIEKLFADVEVKSVHTMNYRGKPKRRGLVVSKRSNFKKAIVTLKKGEIDFYKEDETEEEE